MASTAATTLSMEMETLSKPSDFTIHSFYQFCKIQHSFKSKSLLFSDNFLLNFTL